LEENTAALNVDLSPEDLKKLRDLVDAADVKGARGTGGIPFADTPEP
jgi:hypothetical protein